MRVTPKQVRTSAMKAIRARFELWAPGHFAGKFDSQGSSILASHNGKPWNHLTRGEYAGRAIQDAWITWLASADASSLSVFVGADEKTGFLTRVADALEILCTERPDEKMCKAWFVSESEDLQAWAVDHMRANWGTGIGVIDAAVAMADSPEEGMDHEGDQYDFRQGVTELDAYRNGPLGSHTPDWSEDGAAE